MECCCGGKIVNRTAIDTGIAINTYRENPYGGGRVHVWLSWSGGTADSNSDEMTMPPGGEGNKKVSYMAGFTKPGDPNTSIDAVNLSPCKYDFKKLNDCLSNTAAALDGTLGGDCRKFADKLLGDCKEASKGCTSP